MTEHEHGYTLETWQAEHTTADARVARLVEDVSRSMVLDQLERASRRAAAVLEEIARRGR
jgi:ribosome maturation factor RimP